MSSGGDIYTQLKADHAAAASVLQRLLATDATDTSRCQTLFTELKDRLTRHSEAESTVFYTALRRYPETRALIEESEHQHQRMESLLHELAQMPATAPSWRAQLQTLHAAVEQHVREEEGPLFTKAQLVLTDQQAHDLGQQFAQAQGQSTLTTAKQAVQQGADKATATLREMGDQVQHEAQQIATAAKEKGRTMVREQQQFIAAQLGSVAEALRNTAQHLSGHDQESIAQYTHQAAEGLERFSNTLRTQDFDTLISHVEDFARRQPVAFIGSAAFLGFVAARFLKSSAARRAGPTASPASPTSYHPEQPIVASYPNRVAPSPASPPLVGTPSGSSGVMPTTQGGK
jgi:Hemerythrin HHE cation binding domain